MLYTYSQIVSRASGALTAAALAAALNVLPDVAAAQDKINCIFPFWYGNAPIFVAQEEGYFESEGLKVTTSFDNDRANVLPAMANGSIDCTIRTIGESMSRPRQSDTTGRVIGTIDISVGADGVVAAGDVQSVADLIGKTMAGEINHPGTTLVQHALSQIGRSIEDVNIQLVATDDSAAVFEDSSVSAVATWEPMMSSIVKGTSREGAHILLSSADYEGLITDVIIVRTEDYEENPQKYAKFLRGIYRAIDLYAEDPDKFISIAAPFFDTSDDEMKEALQGMKYTSYEESVAYLPGPDGEGKLKDVLEAFNDINVTLDLQDGPLPYQPYVDGSLLQGLFDGAER
ncbi:ABC transporter substrate-binding protein [Pseudohalocynthiibacter aestuariivivens]|uniref:ABC transporter substrate-binding protein n=1 Tax=Roseovarius pelagicus TaxID=2980108 RepID=A0ABY6D6I1_9RHOB|nr:MULTISPECIES: ABC transporter substrate-binding protein [Rhodobacterales]QIE46281.1 ABC transporter substrate-binding protein [Pseudohalocynthiibacter aestuariivivens]UXX81742.1 ABC transporter substrate-binding protein [Roseovarius pelagicus]